MPFDPSISVTQSALSPSNVTVVDDSSGSDAAIDSRHIFFQTSTGAYLVTSNTSTDYMVWSYADSSKTFDILDEDFAVFITVLWLDASGDTLYTFNDYYCLAEYNKQFAVYLGQQQAASPGIIQDTTYYSNLCAFWANIVYAVTMITEAADISNSQNLLNKATYMRQNETKFF